MPTAHLPFTSRSTVSILVFVELALDEYSVEISQESGLGFNPCFRGTCSWWRVSTGAGRPRAVVSILVFVELALDAQDQDQVVYGITVFQSLFSWNLLLMGEGYMEAWHDSEFQSLFSWNLLLMRMSPIPWMLPPVVSILVFVELALDVLLTWSTPIHPICFNPCFRGTCSWCLPPQALPCILPVSILVFVELALDVAAASCVRTSQSRFNPCFRGTCSWCFLMTPRVYHPNWFQSLFSWNLLLMARVPIAADQQDSRFQSLFSWNLLLMFVGHILHYCQSIVSILVFVELALDDYIFYMFWTW